MLERRRLQFVRLKRKKRGIRNDNRSLRAIQDGNTNVLVARITHNVVVIELFHDQILISFCSGNVNRLRAGSGSRWKTINPHTLMFVMCLMAPWTSTEADSAPHLPRVRIQGFDCNKPARMRRSAIPQNCINWDQPPSNHQDQAQTYELLQKRSKVQFLGHSCSLRISQSFRYCGIWSYEKELIPPKVYERQLLTAEECRRMIDYQKVELPGGSIVEVTAPGLTYVDVVPSGELSVEKGVPSCVGSDLMHEGKLLRSVLQLLSAEISVEEVELEAEIKSNGRLWRRDLGTEVQCQMTTRGCESREGVLIWEPPAPVCPYELIRTVTAVMEEGTIRGAGDEHIWLPLDKEVEVGQLPCPKSRVWSTSVRDLLIASRSAAASQSFPPLDAIEVDMGIQTSVQ